MPKVGSIGVAPAPGTWPPGLALLAVGVKEDCRPGKRPGCCSACHQIRSRTRHHLSWPLAPCPALHVPRDRVRRAWTGADLRSMGRHCEYEICATTPTKACAIRFGIYERCDVCDSSRAWSLSVTHISFPSRLGKA
jgi:hypothetical protein